MTCMCIVSKMAITCDIPPKRAYSMSWWSVLDAQLTGTVTSRRRNMKKEDKKIREVREAAMLLLLLLFSLMPVVGCLQ